jgi:ABC-type oligopeptide transport system substrate-binding subunit
VNVAAPGGRLAPYLQKKGVTLQRNLEPFMQMSYFFMGHPLVGGYTPEKVALRRAIALAFDGPAYLSRVMGGQGILAQSLVSPFTSGYDPAYRRRSWTCTATWTATATAIASSPMASRSCCAWPAPAGSAGVWRASCGSAR